MNGAHIHLLLNHIPILGSLFALCLVAYGIFFKNGSILKAGLVTAVITALISIPAFLSGEEAEHTVENIAGISENTIEHHEEEGEIAFWAMIMAGAVTLGALLSSIKTKKVSSALQWISLVFLVITFALMARAGGSGGKIRHTEIDGVQGSPAAATESNQNNDDD